MTDNFTFSVETTRIRTGIFTFLIDASQVTGAFWVTYTFGFAIRWVSYHFRQTRAWSLVSNDAALSVWSARRWLTRICRWWFLNNFNLTSYERIACVSGRATTNRIVVSNLAFCIYATCAWARIYTLLVVASFILRTFRACDTFWSTSWRSSNITRNTWTNSLTVDLTALWVGSAWRRLARVGFNRCWITRNWRTQEIERERERFRIHTLVRRALNKRISTHAWRTWAHWSVIDHITNSILSACSRTRINTFISNTRLITRAIIAYDTFRSTAWVRIALVFWQTCAYSIGTLGIGSTRRWIAWVITWRFFCYLWIIINLRQQRKTTDCENSYVEEV